MPDETLPEEKLKASLERRLATIMMADVAGYSRMMGKNEEQTVQTLRGHREIFDALLKLHRGRIFNTAGDAILAEFPSAVEAVRCATEIQAAVRTRNEHLPEDQRMWFRIGINLGDVIVQEGDLLGDGVNVAARIQTVAEPGGVCISGSVYDQILNKLSLQFRLLGERSFKNIAQPVRTFSIAEADGTAMPSASASKQTKKGHLFGVVIAVIVLMAGSGGGYWMYEHYQTQRAEEARRATEVERQAAESRRQAEEAKKQADEVQRQAEETRRQAEEAQRQASEAQRKAKEEQMAAEAAQRQAKLEAEAQAAKAALERAEADKKRLDQELKRTAAEKAAAEKAQAQPVVPKPPEPQPLVAVPAAPQPPREIKGIERFDGNYDGRLCNDRQGPLSGKRCWGVSLKVQRGIIQGEWTNPVNGNVSHAKGTISAQGAVSMTIEGWSPTSRPVEASVTGKWDQNGITVSGTWRNGMVVTGDWKRAQ